jgi:hypothetical protein
VFDAKDVKGTMFLEEDIEYGYIIDTSLKNKVQAYLKYDVYNDFFGIQLDRNGQNLKRLERTSRFYYVLNDEKFVLIQTNILNVEHYNSGNGYAVELTTPLAKAVLYKRYYKKFDPGSVSQSSYQANINPSLNTNAFYIIKFGDDFIKAETHKKGILNAFPSDKQSAIKKLISHKEFNFKGSDDEIENDMIQVVRYYNSL